MKSIILWLCGVPIGVIILLKVFGVFGGRPRTWGMRLQA